MNVFVLYPFFALCSTVGVCVCVETCDANTVTLKVTNQSQSAISAFKAMDTA